MQNHIADIGKKVGENMTLQYKPLIKAIEVYLKKADDDLTEMLEDEGRAEPEESVETVDSIETGVEDALEKQNKYLLKEIKKHETLSALMSAGVLEDIFERDKCGKKISKVMSKELGKLIPDLVQTYVNFVDEQLPSSFVSKRTIAWIDSWSTELGDMMKITTHNALSDMIKRSFDNGNDINSLIREIKTSGIRDEYYRARTVAVTEVLRAHNVSRQEAAIQNPCITRKMWRHTGEHKNEPRENHVAMDGQIVDVDKPFALTGMDGTVYNPMFPVDPDLPPEESINCHCIAQDIVDDDILAMPLEERQRLQQEAIDSLDAQWEEEQKAGAENE